MTPTCPRCGHALLDGFEPYCLRCGHREYPPLVSPLVTPEERALFRGKGGRPRPSEAKPKAEPRPRRRKARKLHEVTCERCGRVVEKRDHQRFCSRECSNAVHHHRARQVRPTMGASATALFAEGMA